MNICRLSKNKRGFTLIELLVVIAIIGVLASVVLASLNSAREKSRDARRKSDLKQIQIALELYYDNCGDYRVRQSCSSGPYYGSTGIGWFGYNYGGAGAVSQGLVDHDLTPTEILDPTGERSGNAYMIIANDSNYTLWAKLENPSDADTATLNSCTFSNYDTGYSMNFCLSN